MRGREGEGKVGKGKGGKREGRDGEGEGWGGRGQCRPPKLKLGPPELFSWRRRCTYTCVPLSSSSITWYQSKGGDALRLEGDRRSGDALATSQTLWFIHLRAHGPRKGDEPPPTLNFGRGPPLLLFYLHSL